MVSDWEKIVTDIAKGYSFGLDDYLNDMDGRRILGEALEVAFDEQKRDVTERVKIADTLFFSVTYPSAHCIWNEKNELEYGYSRDTDWWYYRIPIKIKRERHAKEFMHLTSSTLGNEQGKQE